MSKNRPPGGRARPRVLPVILAVMAMMVGTFVSAAPAQAAQVITLPHLDNEIPDLCVLKTEAEVKAAIDNAGVMPSGPYEWYVNLQSGRITVQADINSGSDATFELANNWNLPDDRSATYFIECGASVDEIPVSPPEVILDCSTVVGTIPPVQGLSYNIEIGAGGSTIYRDIHVTADPGYTLVLTPALKAMGWREITPGKLATLSIRCGEVPPKEGMLLQPEVTQGTCTADNEVSKPYIVIKGWFDNIAYRVNDTPLFNDESDNKLFFEPGETITIQASAQGVNFPNPLPSPWAHFEGNVIQMTITFEDVDCVKPVAPVAPTVTQAICNEDGTITAPEVTPATTEGVEYKLDGEVKAGSTVTVTATAAEGFTLTAAEGWVLSDDAKSATFEVKLDNVECEQPPVEVAPVAPTVVQAICTAEGDQTAASVSTATTQGIEYSIEGDVAAGNTVTVKAIAAEGYVLTAAEGWTLSEDVQSATFEVKLDEVNCEQPLVEVAPVAPTVTQAVCNADGTSTEVSVVTAATEGIEYKIEGDVKPGSTVTVIATAAAGHKLVAAEGWTLAADAASATFEIKLDDVDCTQPPVEVTPVAPSVEQATCTAEGDQTAASVVTASTEGIEYSIEGEVAAGKAVIVKAVAAEGHGLKAAEGWALSDDAKSATFEVKLDAVDCEKPLVEVTPVNPTVTQAVCNEDGSVTEPSVVGAATEGIEYKVSGDMKPGSTVKVAATATKGHKLAEAEGWTLAKDGLTATFKVKLDTVECKTPKPTETPTPKPSESKTPSPAPSSSTGVPKTGSEGPSSTPDDGKLAHTGADLSPWMIGGAAVLLLIGGALVALTRSRRKHG